MNDAEQLPRLWVGLDSITPPTWRWSKGRWFMSHSLIMSEVFVPGNQPKPTTDPAEMVTIATCKEIDWDD